MGVTPTHPRPRSVASRFCTSSWATRILCQKRPNLSTFVVSRKVRENGGEHSANALNMLLVVQRYDAGTWTLSALSMLKTLSLARRPSLKLLPIIPGCNTGSRLRHGLRLQSSSTMTATAHRAARAPGPRMYPNQFHKPPLPPLPKSKLQRLRYILRKEGDMDTVIRFIQDDPRLAEYFTHPSDIGVLFRQMCDSSTAQYVVNLIDVANAMGFTVPYSTFDALCARAFGRREWDVLLALAEKGIEETGVSEQLLCWRFRALTQKLDFRWLRTALDDLTEAGIQPSRKTFHLMLSAALYNVDIAQAQRIVELMKEHGVAPDASTHTLIARLHRKVGSDDTVEDNVISALREVPHSEQTAALNSLIQGHMESHAIHRALPLLSLFAPESVETIIEVLSGSVGGGHTADASSYPEPLPNPPVADAATYAIFMLWCSHNRNLSGALQLLQAMITSGIPMTERTVTALVETCFTCGRPDLAVQLVAGVCDPATTPSRMFLPLHPEPWPEQRFEIHVPDMQPTERVFNALLRGTLQYYGLNGAKHVLHIMAKNEVLPNRTTVFLILGYMFTVERSRPRTMIRVLHALTGLHLLPTQDHVGLIIRCIQREEDYLIHGRGWEKLKFGLGGGNVPKAKQVTTSPDFETFAGMVLPTFRGYRTLMEPFFEDIRFRDVKPNAKTICLRIRHEAVINMDMDTAYDVFETMLARGIKASIHHYNALMEGYALRGDTRRVLGVMKSATEAGIALDAFSYTILITAYGRRGEPEKGLKTFGNMVEAGIKPDVPSIDAVAANFYALGKNTMAKKVLIRLWPYVGEFPEKLADAGVLEIARYFRTLHTRARNAEVAVSNERREQIHFSLIALMRDWRRAEKKLRKQVEDKEKWSVVKSRVSSEWDAPPDEDDLGDEDGSDAQSDPLHIADNEHAS